MGERPSSASPRPGSHETGARIDVAREDPLEALLVDVRRALLTGPTPRRDFEAMLSRANKLA